MRFPNSAVVLQFCVIETFKSSVPNQWQLDSWAIMVKPNTLTSLYSELCHSYIETQLLGIVYCRWKKIDCHRCCYKKKTVTFVDHWLVWLLSRTVQKTDRYSDYYYGERLSVNTFFVQIYKNRTKTLRRMIQRCWENHTVTVNVAFTGKNE